MEKMQSISCKEIRENMSDVINKVAYKGDMFTVTRRGSDVAVLMSMEDWKEMERLIEQMEDEDDIRVSEARLKEFREGKTKTIPHEVVKKNLGL